MQIFPVLLIISTLIGLFINHQRNKSIRDSKDNRKRRKIQGQEYIKFDRNGKVKA